jgi:polyhydroxyalkanoate synthesis regulator phasin
MIDANKRTEELREISGSVTYSDPLTTFLYLLMRNDLPAGTVEALVRESVNSAEECTFTNGWLAHYAHNLAEELKNARVSHLKSALDKAFEAEEQARKKKAKEEEKARIQEELDEVSESLTDDELASLEAKIKAEAGLDAEEEKESLNEAKEVVEQMVAQGHLSEEEAEAMKEDIEEAARPPAVEVEKDNEGHKMSVEEAKEMVESAISEADLVKDWVKELDKDGYGIPIPPVESPEVYIAKIKSKGFFDKLNEDIADKIGKPEVPDFSEDESKWKNTNEELQKIEEEIEPEEE